MAQPASHGFDGNGQGRFPQGLAPQGLVPVHYSNHFNGSNTISGFNYSSNPYGNFASAAGGYDNNYDFTPNSSAMPATFDGSLRSEIPHAPRAENPPSQSARSFNPATKHWRTPTMDQEFQPKPTRAKRGESHNDESPGLRQVDKEWVYPSMLTQCCTCGYCAASNWWISSRTVQDFFTSSECFVIHHLFFLCLGTHYVLCRAAEPRHKLTNTDGFMTFLRDIISRICSSTLTTFCELPSYFHLQIQSQTVMHALPTPWTIV